jgi:stress-induced morphogen
LLQILTGIRSANVEVKDLSNDASALEVTVVSPKFEGLQKFKRRDMVMASLDELHKQGVQFNIATLNMMTEDEWDATQQQ